MPAVMRRPQSPLAWATSRSRKPMHASSSAASIHSSAVCAWAISPGPQITLGMPRGLEHAGFRAIRHGAGRVAAGQALGQHLRRAPRPRDERRHVIDHLGDDLGAGIARAHRGHDHRFGVVPHLALHRLDHAGLRRADVPLDPAVTGDGVARSAGTHHADADRGVGRVEHADAVRGGRERLNPAANHADDVGGKEHRVHAEVGARGVAGEAVTRVSMPQLPLWPFTTPIRLGSPMSAAVGRKPCSRMCCTMPCTP